MTTTQLITVYARREPTTDSVANSVLRTLEARPRRALQDVQIYKDAGASESYARFPWDASRKPRRTQKTVTVNCWNWALVWLPDAPALRN